MNFRQLNQRSVPDAYPLPKIQAILDRLGEGKYINSLDLGDGYWQVPLDEASKQLTAFSTPRRVLY